MGILTKLFGYEGKIRFEGKTVDGREFEGSMHIESIGLTQSEIEDKLKNIFYVEKGIRAAELRIIASG